MAGGWIDNSRNGTKTDQNSLKNRRQDCRGSQRSRRSGRGRKGTQDPWLLACCILLGLAIFTTAVWLILAMFHTPVRFLSILENRGMEGLWEVIVQFWQRP